MSDGRYLARPLSSLLGFTAALCSSLTLVHAQNSAIDELRGKIFDARMAQQNFCRRLEILQRVKWQELLFSPTQSHSQFGGIFPISGKPGEGKR